MLITRRNVNSSHKDVYISSGHNCDMHSRGLYTSLYLSLHKKVPLRGVYRLRVNFIIVPQDLVGRLYDAEINVLFLLNVTEPPLACLAVLPEGGFGSEDYR